MNSSLIKLNLGCGPNGLEDWLNYDWGALPLLSKFPNVRKWGVRWGVLAPGYDTRWPQIQLVDIRKKLPLKSEVVNFIYCSHVLEHLERWQALHVLKESFRVLIPGGLIRIAVPDLDYICRNYLESKSNSTKQTRAAQEACILLWGHRKDVAPAGFLSKWVRKFIRGHEWAYDEHEMALLLSEAGFKNIKKQSFRTGEVPDIDRLDLESHVPHSLYMEASK
jgi:SAM-dependent methyltransferase